MALFSSDKKKETKSAKSVRRARGVKLSHGRAHDTLLSPWFSEKAMLLTEKGVYVFAVPLRATKAEISGAVKEVYKVSPRKIRVVTVMGKTKAMRTRRGEGSRSKRRKAYVYLAKGETIQFV